MLHGLVEETVAFITAAARDHPYWGFPIALAIAFMESFVGLSFLVPGFLLLVTLGAVIGASHANVLPAWAGAVLGAVAGDWISWWVGCHYHHKIVHFRWFRRFEDQVERALQFFHKWGAWAVFFGRFLGPLRATVPLVAGMSELEFLPFMVANIASALIWATLLLTPGAEILRHFFG
jgi:membrane protein DedA with SNARE-associated domain